MLYEGRTESHEQLFLHANWEQQTKESAVVDGTSCCVILEGLVTSIACITWLVSLLTKWPTTMSFRQRAVIEFLVKEEIPAAQIHQRLQRAYGSVCMGASSVRRWVKHFKDGENGGNSESSASSVSSDGWKGVLPQGNFQTSRTLRKMCTKKWRLCGKIKKIV